jgi:class 3 adenylate cyclase
VVGFALLLLALVALCASPLSRYLDHRLLDAQLGWIRAIRAESPVQGAIVVVGIDEATVARLPEPLALWHRHLGAFLQAMARAGARAVELDVVLPDRSYDDLVEGLDRALLVGFVAARRAELPVVIAQTVDAAGGTHPLFAPVVSVAGADAIGLALLEPDADGVLRRAESILRTVKGAFPTLLGRMAAILEVGQPAGIIDYAAGPGFDYVALHDVLQWHAAGDLPRLRESFAAKVVLLGSVEPFVDRSPVPVPIATFEPDEKRVPGVLVQAQALRSVLGRGLIGELPDAARIALALVATMPWWFARRAGPGALACLVVAVLASVGSTWLLGAGYWLPAGAALAVAGGALAARLALGALVARHERRRLEASFSRYVSPGVMREILRGRLRPSVGGERRRVCVLFSDIRGFTSRSETQPPEAIIALLNDYFEEMTAAVHEHGGTVDKFIGDGLMAFFGAPAVRSNPPQDAFDAAREMVGRLVDLNARLMARGVEPIAIGIGLQHGDAVVGHVGSSSRHEYTVIGDTVNTAARLEGLTKGLGYPVVCAAEVVAALEERSGLVDLGPQEIRGRAAVPVYGWRSGTTRDTGLGEG